MRVTVDSSSSGCLHFGREAANLDSPISVRKVQNN